MVHEKRKGKEIAPQGQPSQRRRKTRAKREAEAALSVAEAAERAEAGGALQIGQCWSTRARQQAPSQTETPQSSSRPRTRGGATPQSGRGRGQSAQRQPLQRQQQWQHVPPETGPRLVTATTELQLLDLRMRTSRFIKGLRYEMMVDEFYPRPRDTRTDHRFWTVVQASLYESALRGGHKLMP